MITVTIQATSVHGLLTDLRALALSMEKGISSISAPQVSIKPIEKITSAQLLEEQINLNPKPEDESAVKKEKKAKAKAAPAPVVEEKAEEETEAPIEAEASLDPEDNINMDEVTGLTLEGDILPAFMAFTKKNAAKMGKAEAVSNTNAIVKKLGYKSVRDIEEKDFGRALKAIGA